MFTNQSKSISSIRATLPGVWTGRPEGRRLEGRNPGANLLILRKEITNLCENVPAITNTGAQSRCSMLCAKLFVVNVT